MRLKTLNPSFPQSKHNYDFKPTDIVYIPVILDDNIFKEIYPLVCNIAYLTERDAKTHFWIKGNLKAKKTEIRSMTVNEFLKNHDWQGMNPFETLNKLEFKLKYKEKYPEYNNET